MSTINQNAFLERARRALEEFCHTHAERRDFSPTLFPSQMSELDWWDALLKYTKERRADIKARPTPRVQERKTPAQLARAPESQGGSRST